MASIRKRDGKYQVQVRKDGKSISKTFTNKSDAVKWSKEQEVSIEQGMYISKTKSVSFSFLLSRWEQEVLMWCNSFCLILNSPFLILTSSESSDCLNKSLMSFLSSNEYICLPYDLLKN